MHDDKQIRKLAFIDDDDISHIIFQTLIRRISPTTKVEEFSSAVDAFAKINDQTFDASAIILDINMPRMTGWDFLEKIKGIGFQVPVYMLTSSDDSRDRARAKEFPIVQGYFLKPFQRDQLELVIKKHFN
jgi:CheY-like chemotaxis protein